MNVRFVVNLTPEERNQLESFVGSGSQQVRIVKRAQILLAADGDDLLDEDIVKAVSTSTSTVYRIKQRFVEEGLEAALHDRPRPRPPRLLSPHQEALLVATACTEPPTGRARWTLELLAGEMVRLTGRSISDETIRRRLKEKKLKPWLEKMWCIPKVDAEFVARMEDVLDLYAEPADLQYPVVNFDETPRQLLSETRVPVPPKPGQPARIDYEYRRNGTVNLFVFFDRHRGWREVKCTDHRTNLDFAECMRDLVDVHYPSASRIRVVLDNLSTHTQAALYEAFPPEEARRILRRLEFHYTPKHASWLNMVEIEIGVLAQQCLDRRIPDKASLSTEIAAWVTQRNHERAGINWLFDVETARVKMGRVYPKRKDTPQPLAAIAAA